MPRFAAINRGSPDRRRSSVPRWRLILKLSLFGLLGCFVFFLWFWHTGLLSRKHQQALDAFVQLQVNAGLQVKKIKIKGRRHLSQSEVMHTLNIKPGAPLTSFDMQKAFQSLSHHPWVKHLSLHREWPHTIEVVLEERTPVALWQHRKRVALIDSDGTIITDHIQPFMAYPLILGYGAPRHANKLIQSLEKTPTLKDEIKSAQWVGERRWDLHLKNGVTIKLPESGYPQALKTLMTLENRQGLLKRAKKVVDLRLPKRMVIQ